MRMKFAIAAAVLLTSFGVQAASAATSATFELINMDEPKASLMKADIDLTKSLPQRFIAQATMGYVIAPGYDPAVTPETVTVSYTIEVQKTKNGAINSTVDASYLGDNGFIPVDKMNRQFAPVSDTETVDIPRKADYKEVIFIPYVGGPNSHLALRVTPHYAK